MRIDFVARGVRVDDETKEWLEKKLAKLGALIGEPASSRVVCEGTRYRKAVEAHLLAGGNEFHARIEDVDLLEAAQRAVAAIASQVRRARKRGLDRHRRVSRSAATDRHWPVDVLSRESLLAGNGPRVVKSSRFQIEPMTVDQALAALEASRNDFLVFQDRSNRQVSVLYKRKDDDFGLIVAER